MFSPYLNACKDNLNKLQKNENKVFRLILNVPIYTAIGFLRGEIGASDVVSRDIKNKILFLKHALTEDRNQLLQSIMMHNINLNDTIWIRKTKQYLQDIGLDVNDICTLSVQMIKNKINEYDTNKWI